MRPGWVLTLGWLVAVVPTAARAYLLQPFPGSQSLETVRLAYWVTRVVPAAQAVGIVLALVGLVGCVRRGLRRRGAVAIGVAAAVAAGAFYAGHRLRADVMFRPPEAVRFATGTSEELPPETLVMGITAGEEARAYPLRLLAYHHRVEDQLAGEPILVTYCTMCRTGKVFRPEVEGRPVAFDLVGAQTFNSFYRERGTGSWWCQANGKFVVGPLAGQQLPELLADQMTLAEWLTLHPDSEVLQPDPASADGYKMFGFADFDSARPKEERGPGWQWVVGVQHGGVARAYPWSLLTEERLLVDEVAGLPLAVELLADGISYRVWDRRLDGAVLDLSLDAENDLLVDAASGSTFGFDGVARDGALAGRRLTPVAATLEYWHSFHRFSGGELYTPPEAAEGVPGAG